MMYGRCIRSWISNEGTRDVQRGAQNMCHKVYSNSGILDEMV